MSRGRPFTAAEHDRIDEMLRDGESLSAIARAIGRHKRVVSRYAERAGLYERYERRLLSPTERAAIVAMYEKRSGMAAIQRRYGVCLSTIYSVLDAAGVPRRYPARGAGPRRRMLALHRQEAPAP